MRLRDSFPTHRASHNTFRVYCAYICKNLIVYGNRWSVIAPPKAGNIPNLHIFRSRTSETPLKVRTKFTCSIQMAAHVCTNAHVCPCGRREMKVWIETGDAVNLIERSLCALRKPFEFRLRQEAVAKLNSPKIVKDHGAVSRVKKHPQFFECSARCELEC
jgi:hypothetical protein